MHYELYHWQMVNFMVNRRRCFSYPKALSKINSLIKNFPLVDYFFLSYHLNKDYLDFNYPFNTNNLKFNEMNKISKLEINKVVNFGK